LLRSVLSSWEQDGCQSGSREIPHTYGQSAPRAMQGSAYIQNWLTSHRLPAHTRGDSSWASAGWRPSAGCPSSRRRARACAPRDRPLAGPGSPSDGRTWSVSPSRRVPRAPATRRARRGRPKALAQRDGHHAAGVGNDRDGHGSRREERRGPGPPEQEGAPRDCEGQHRHEGTGSRYTPR